MNRASFTLCVGLLLAISPVVVATPPFGIFHASIGSNPMAPTTADAIVMGFGMQRVGAPTAVLYHHFQVHDHVLDLYADMFLGDFSTGSGGAHT